MQWKINRKREGPELGAAEAARGHGGWYTPSPAMDVRLFRLSSGARRKIWDALYSRSAAARQKRAARLLVLAGFAAGLLGAASLALSAGAPPARPRTAPAAPRTRPNLVLITLDTTRADHLGAYGWKAA